MFRIFFILFFLLALSACGAMSATTMRCGMDGDSSYVEVVSAPQSISSNTRALADLCAFSFERDD